MLLSLLLRSSPEHTQNTSQNPSRNPIQVLTGKPQNATKPTSSNKTSKLRSILPQNGRANCHGARCKTQAKTSPGRVDADAKTAKRHKTNKQRQGSKPKPVMPRATRQNAGQQQTSRAHRARHPRHNTTSSTKGSKPRSGLPRNAG